MEARGVLKSHPAPPCLPGSPILARGTSAQYCAELSSPARPFVSPLFCVNQMPFVRSQTCCVHRHTNLPAQSVGNAGHIQIMRCTLPRPGTRAGGTGTTNSCCPRQGLQLGFGVAAVGKVQVPIPQRVRVSLGAVCPAERSRGLLALLSLAMSFPPLLVLSIL